MSDHIILDEKHQRRQATRSSDVRELLFIMQGPPHLLLLRPSWPLCSAAASDYSCAAGQLDICQQHAGTPEESRCPVEG